MLFCSARIHCWYSVIIEGRNIILLPEYTCILFFSLWPMKTGASSSHTSLVFLSAGCMRATNTQCFMGSSSYRVKTHCRCRASTHLSSHWSTDTETHPHIQENSSAEERLTSPSRTAREPGDKGRVRSNMAHVKQGCKHMYGQKRER